MKILIFFLSIIFSFSIFSCAPSPIYKGSKIPSEKSHPQKVKNDSKKNIPASDEKNNNEIEKPSAGTKYRGIASFYADQYHGRKTSNGETFDMNGLTAAHNTLPFNTWVEVKNLSNGRTVIVRINDRGPFIDGRIIDLSYGAAKELRMIGKGLQEVEITVLR